MNLSKELINECYKIINKENERSTWKELAEKFGFNDGENLRQKFKSYRKKLGVLGTNKIYKESITINKDGTQLSDKKIESDDIEKLKDEEYILEMHGYDKSKWEVVNSKNSFWDAQKKGGYIVKLYSSKLTVKPRVNPIWTKDLIKDLFNTLDEKPRNNININLNKNIDSEKLLFARPADFHYNLKSSMLVTGNEYNVDIAEDYLSQFINETYNRTKGIKFEKVLFTIGDDFLNADNIQGTTTAGTPQDNDLCWEEAYKGCIKLIRDCIENLREIAPVDVINIQSNHDQHSMFGIAEALNLRYEDVDSINIINNPQPTQYYKYGKNLIVLAHDMDVKRALEIITSSKDGNRYWSECDNVMCFLAHKHQAMQYHNQGKLQVYRLPTISGWSRWANGKGFHHADKRADVYIIDKNIGVTDKKVISIVD